MSVDSRLNSIVKDKIGDVSIKYQFGTDETWSRALRHVRGLLSLADEAGGVGEFPRRS